MTSGAEVCDSLVVGAGFGGLGAALALARRGRRVVVCEALPYLGGCAGTFERGGARYEAGATLCAGFAPGQLFRSWLEEEGITQQISLEALDPVLIFRAPHMNLAIDAKPRGVERALSAIPDAPREALAKFFELQRSIARALWPLLDDPQSLPRLRGRGWLQALGLGPRLLPHSKHLLRTSCRSLAQVIAAAGLSNFDPLRVFADALCQITLQCRSNEAEAPLALSAFDYYERGVTHVVGGIGTLAELLGSAIEARGGSVLRAHRVTAIERTGDGFHIRTSKRELRAHQVVLNVLPADAAALLRLSDRERAPLARAQARVEGGWGACMLYARIQPKQDLAMHAQHWQLVDDATAPYIEGNCIFASLGSTADMAACDQATRSLSVSTHVDLRALLALPEPERAQRVHAIQARMRQTLQRRAPELHAAWLADFSASPRTFARFTGRRYGWVGGIPRRAGWRAYADLRPVRCPRGIALVGDSNFPGQSALAAAAGGYRTAWTM